MDIAKDIGNAGREAAALRKDDRIEEALALLESLESGRTLNAAERAFILVGKADCYRFSGRENEAFDCFKQARDLNPANIFAQVGLGNLYLRRQQPQEAKGCFEYALWQEPHNKFAREGLIKTDRALGLSNTYQQAAKPAASTTVAPIVTTPVKPLTATEQLKERLRVNPKDIGAHFQLANILIQQDKPDDAADHLWNVLERDKTHAGALRALAQLDKPSKRPEAEPAPARMPETKPATLAAARQAEAPVASPKATTVTKPVEIPAPVSTPAPKQTPQTLEEFEVIVNINGVPREICTLQINIPAGIEDSADWEKSVGLTVLSHCENTKLFKEVTAAKPARRTLTRAPKPE